MTDRQTLLLMKGSLEQMLILVNSILETPEPQPDLPGCRHEKALDATVMGGPKQKYCQDCRQLVVQDGQLIVQGGCHV